MATIFSKLGRLHLLSLWLLFAGVNPLLGQENLLLNGGFEEWGSPPLGPRAVNFENGEVPVQWIADLRPEDQEEPRPLIARDILIKRSGMASVRLETVEGMLVGIGLRSDKSWHPAPVAIEPGKKYVARGWVKGENLATADPQGKFIRALVYLGNGGNFFGEGAQNRQVPAYIGEEGTSDWTPFQFEFETSPEEESLFFTVSFLGSGKIWLDDLEIVLLDGQKK